MKTIITHSSQETMAVAMDFAKSLKPGAIVLLNGDLGAGKTTFVKGVAKALKVNPQKVTSPTFVLMNYYQGKLPLYHFDLYRLEKPEEIASMNFDEYFYGEGISLIEWPQRLGDTSFKACYKVDMTHLGDNKREICIAYR